MYPRKKKEKILNGERTVYNGSSTKQIITTTKDSEDCLNGSYTKQTNYQKKEKKKGEKKSEHETPQPIPS